MKHVDIQSYHATALGSNYKACNKPTTDNRNEFKGQLPDGLQPVFMAPTNNETRKSNAAPNTPSTSRVPRTMERGRSSLVPHLYAEQRVRQRSVSRDPPLANKKDGKKVVAFGRTTTIKENTSAPSTRPPSTSSNHIDTKLHSEVNQLRSRVDGIEKRNKDIDQLQKLVKVLLEERVIVNDKLEQLHKTRQEQHKTIQEMQKIVQEISDSNSSLVKRLDELEAQRENAAKSPPLQSTVTKTTIPASPQFQSMAPVSRVKDSRAKDRVSDMLFSRLPESTNRKIQQITNDVSNKKRANTSRDTTNERQRYANTSYKNRSNDSRRFAQMSVRDESARSQSRDGHISQQVLVLTEADDGYRFDQD